MRISSTEIKSTPPAQLHACLHHQAKAKRMPRPGTCSLQQNTPCPLTPPRLVQDQTKGKPKSHENQHKLTQSKSPEGTRRKGPPFPANPWYKVSNFHHKILTLGEKRGRTSEREVAHGRESLLLWAPGKGKREKERVGRERDIYPPLTLD